MMATGAHPAAQLSGDDIVGMFFFALIVLGWFRRRVRRALAGLRDRTLAGLRDRTLGRRAHDLAILQLQLEIERERRGAGQPAAAVSDRVQVDEGPRPCTHRRVTPVTDSLDDVVAWLCKNPDCGERLPANYAVRAEDLP